MNSRPTFAEIDLAALRHNFQTIRRAVPDGVGILAVVKADAYGHGYRDISRELENLGAAAFGVAFLTEGTKLRKCGISKPILLFGGLYPGEEKSCIEQNISTAVFSLTQAQALDKAAGELHQKAGIHLKVDTGMGRLGIAPHKAREFFHTLKQLGNLVLEGIFTHFATADDLGGGGVEYADMQAGLFREVLREAGRQGFSPRYVHIANSAATFSRSAPFCNLVRPGIVLYGALPSADFQGKMDLQPVMRLKSRIAMLKWVDDGKSISYARRYTTGGTTLVASVPIGYADGYPRALTNRGEALVRGTRARVIGTVCMDWIMLDVTDVPGVSVGDEVILLGCDEAGRSVMAEELASWAGTISYEIFCGISKRVPRVHLGG